MLMSSYSVDALWIFLQLKCFFLILSNDWDDSAIWKNTQTSQWAWPMNGMEITSNINCNCEN